MAFDLHRHPFTGLGVNVGSRTLDHIWIQRSLGQVIKRTQSLALLLEDTDEFGADDLSLLLRIGDVLQLADETLPGIDVFHMDIEFPIKEIHQKFGLPFAHEALVDEHAGELITDGLLQQKGQGG